MTHASIAAYALLLPTLALVANQDPERIDWERLSRRLDADGDGQVTREEFPRRPALFRRLDRNRDGVLTPADFGVMSIALVVVGFVEIFAQIGIGPSIVQKATLAADDLRTAGLFSVALGALFYAGLWAAAPAVGAWYSDALLSDVLRVIALSFILGGVAVVPRSYLVRQMAFKRLFVGAMAGMLVGNFGVGLLLASQGAGVWAYVAALLTQNFVLRLVYWGFTWRASRRGR